MKIFIFHHFIAIFFKIFKNWNLHTKKILIRQIWILSYKPHILSTSLHFKNIFSPGTQNAERQKDTLFPRFISNDKTAQLKT